MIGGLVVRVGAALGGAMDVDGAVVAAVGEGAVDGALDVVVDEGGDERAAAPAWCPGRVLATYSVRAPAAATLAAATVLVIAPTRSSDASRRRFARRWCLPEEMSCGRCGGTHPRYGATLKSRLRRGAHA
jgi:hypothetical protein